MSEETEPEKTNSEPSSISKEENLDLAREMLRSGAQIENVVAASGLGRQRVLGLKGSLVKASKRLEVANKRSEAENERETGFQAENEPDGNIGVGMGSHVSAPIVTPEAPATFVVRPSLTREEWTKYSKMKTADLVSEIADLKSQNVSLQGVAQTRRGNGGGHDSYAENPYAQKILQIAEAKELKELLGLGKNGHESEAIKELKLEIRELKQSLQNNPLGFIKLGVDAFKAGTDSASKPQGIDPAQYILAGASMRESIEKNVQNQFSVGVQKSEIDLKLEAMRQGERIDFKRLELDEKKWERKEEAEGKKWELVEKGIKALASEPVAGFLQKVGGGVADRLHGPGGRIPMVDILCPNPNCGAKFKGNPSLSVLTCPSCGAGMVKKDQPSQPQPPTEPQPSEEQPSPGETRQETEPKGNDVSTDAEVK